MAGAVSTAQITMAVERGGLNCMSGDSLAFRFKRPPGMTSPEILASHQGKSLRTVSMKQRNFTSKSCFVSTSNMSSHTNSLSGSEIWDSKNFPMSINARKHALIYISFAII